MTRRSLVATLALCLVGLTGCAGAQPGVAATVGEETIRVSELNRITDGYCRAIERQLSGEGGVRPMEFLSSNILRLLVLTAATRQLAEDYGVEPTSVYTDSLAVQEQSAAGLPPEVAEATVMIGSSGDYLGDILTSIGRQTLMEDGAEEPNTDAALVRGQDVLSVWLTKNEPEIDPQFGIDVSTLEPMVTDTSTSFAVSDDATIALRSDLFGGDPAQLSAAEQERLTELTDYARGLPESQRCG